MVSTQLLMAQLLSGVIQGLTLLAITLGLSLTFGVVGVINFAHGEFVTIGAYVSLLLYPILGPTGGLFGAIVLAPVLVGVIALGIERFTFRPLEGRNPLYYLLLTFGLSIVLRRVLIILWGARGTSLDVPALLDFSVVLFSRQYDFYNVFFIVAVSVLAVVFYAVLEYTEHGRAVRAVAHDAEAAAMMGINPRWTKSLSFVFGAAVAAVSGVFLAPMLSVYPFLGFDNLLLAFAAIVAGGLGSLRGTSLMAMLFGIISSVSLIWIPAIWSVTIPFAITIVILATLDNGIEDLLARAEEMI